MGLQGSRPQPGDGVVSVRGIEGRCPGEWVTRRVEGPAPEALFSCSQAAEGSRTGVSGAQCQGKMPAVVRGGDDTLTTHIPLSAQQPLPPGL